MNNHQRMNINEFCETFGYTNGPQTRAFEFLANYSVLASLHSHDSITVDIQDSVSNCEINGVIFDGFAVLLDGHVMMSKQSITDYFGSNIVGNAEIVIVESELSGFVSDNISYISGMVDKAFASVFGDIDVNSKNIEEPADDLITHLYAMCTRYSSPLPSLHFYMVSDENSEVNKSTYYEVLKTLKAKYLPLDAFSVISGDYLDTAAILKLYSRSKQRDTVCIMPYKNTIPLPSMAGVKDAYIAVVPFSEFKKLLTDDDIKIKTSIFHDNIRAFQGKTSVSRQMNETLADGNFDLFIAMNNGITVIASELTTKQGGVLELTDYQIVNGCQTCHILFDNRKLKGINDLQLLVKIICSTNENVRNSVIMGTNSQIEVKREQLIALTGLQERIEDYYTKIRTNNNINFEHLYYERRSKQYITETRVPQSKVITIPIVIMSFGSIFLSSPHYVAGYYSQIIENLKNKGKGIFSEEYRVDPYYTSGLMFYKLSQAFSSGKIPSSYRQVKYQVLYASRLIAEIDYGCMPSLETSGIEDYCNYLNKVFCDDEKCISVFKKAIDVIEYVLGTVIKSSDAQRKDLTGSITAEIERIKSRNTQEAKDEAFAEKTRRMISLINSDEESYLRTTGLRQAITSIAQLISVSNSELSLLVGNIQSQQNNSDEVVSALDAFLERGGKLRILFYNAKDDDLINSSLCARLSRLKSESKDIEIKRLSVIPRLLSDNQKLRFNMYLYDNKSTRIELQSNYTVGQLWLQNVSVAISYKEIFEKHWSSKDNVIVDICGMFGY